MLVTDSHVNMEMELLARFDLGHVLDQEKEGEGVAGLVNAPIDHLWRCYSSEALIEGPNGERGGYNFEGQSWNYCNRHDELKAELEGR
jgi:hypothetical protein